MFIFFLDVVYLSYQQHANLNQAKVCKYSKSHKKVEHLDWKNNLILCICLWTAEIKFLRTARTNYLNQFWIFKNVCTKEDVFYECFFKIRNPKTETQWWLSTGLFGSSFLANRNFQVSLKSLFVLLCFFFTGLFLIFFF